MAVYYFAAVPPKGYLCFTVCPPGRAHRVQRDKKLTLPGQSTPLAVLQRTGDQAACE